MLTDTLLKQNHPETIIEVVKGHARQTPDKTAYIFLKDGEQQEVKLTYKELDKKARQVALSLQLKFTDAKDKRILLVYPQGLEFIVAFIGTLYAGAIAVLVNPPVSNKMASRVNGIVEDCEVSAVLSCTEVIGQMYKLGILSESSVQNGNEHIKLSATDWFDTEKMIECQAAQFKDIDRSLDDIAFLQYSSGSTGTPKGVMVSHGNLIANQKSIQHFMGISPDSVVIGWLPMIHDMGLIGNVLSPLYFGATLVFMTPLHFMRRPVRWLKAISRYRGTVSGGPNFAYGLCAAKVKREDLADLDLSSWKVAFTGAEPVQRETLDAFQKTFSECGLPRQALMPVYGLAEATLIVSGIGIEEVADNNNEFDYISNGQCIPGDAIKIVDPESKQVINQDGTEGEIWYSGDSVAQGYWNNPQQTEHTFRARLEGDDRHYLRTGDTGFVAQGELFITGRMADIIIVKGRNYHAEDLEWSIHAVPGVRAGSCTAFAISLAETESVVMVVGTDTAAPSDWHRIVEEIRQRIFSDYQLQLSRVVLVKPKQIPTTTSGKVRRKESGRMLEQGELTLLFDSADHQTASDSDTRANFVPAGTEQELKIAKIWSDLLNIPVREIGIHDNFFELGGASLTMLELANQLGTTMEHLFRFPTIYGYLNDNNEYSFPDVEKDIHLPPAAIDPSLTNPTNTTLITGGAGFFGLHFLQAMMQRSKQSFVLVIRGKDQEHMLQKFNQAVSYFDMQSDMDLSRITFIRGDLSEVRLGMSDADWEWCAHQVDRIVHIGSHVNNWLPYEGIKQINVEGTRTLLTLARYKRKKEFHYTSTTTFTPEKSDPSVFLESDDIDKNEINRYFGYDISKYASESMCKLARQQGLTCNIYRLVWVGGQLSSGRTKVNDGFNIMLRILTTLGVYPSGHYPHDIVPVDLMAEGMATLVGKCRDMDFNLTSLSKESISMERIVAMLSNMGYELQEVSRAEFVDRIRNYPIELWDEHCRSYRQLVIRLFESEQQKLEAYYDSSNFREMVAPDVREKLERKFIDHWFEKKVAFLIRQNALPTVSGLSYQEETNNINRSNSQKACYPLEKTLAALFIEQVKRTPDALAVIAPSEQMTYQQLDWFSDCIADKIVQAGVPADSFVGVCIGRHPLQMSALLGILKAGCAYLPLDPTFSTPHLDFMVSDSGARLILTDDKASSKMAHHQNKALKLSHDGLEAEFRGWSQQDFREHHRHQHSDQLAYITYTSGSTGKPKGVQIKQRTVINHNFNMIEAFQLQAKDRGLQFTTMNFDVSVQEIFPLLFVGAAIVQASREALTELEDLPRIIADNKVTALSFPTAFWHACSHLPFEQAGARLVSIIGEQADLARYNQFRKINPGLPVFNGYGPTEATVIVTWRKLTGHLSAIDIGYPLNNVQIHILDDELSPLPMGMVGKLYIAGDCLAYGYLNRPENQQKAFIANPFCQGELMYDSGDLACWNTDGSITFKGRVDSQVKVNGYRIELNAIESTLCTCPGVQTGAVIVKDMALKRRIVAFFKAANDSITDADVRHYLERQLPNYMVPHLLIPLAEIPLNSNDKIDRNALQQLDVSALVGADYLAPKTSTEQLLCEKWQQLLDIEQVSIRDNFFELGGHSLLLMQLITQLQDKGLVISAQQFITAKNLAKVAEIIENNSKEVGENFRVPENLIPEGCQHIRPDMLPLVNLTEAELDAVAAVVPGGMANIQDIYPLGPLQQGILFSHLLSEKNDPYIMTVTTHVANEIALVQLKQALQVIIDRHDVLRTSIVWQNISTAVQVVRRQAELPIHHLGDVAGYTDIQQAIASLKEKHNWMDLKTAPLLQIDLLSIADGSYLAQIKLHHIVSDQVGLEVIQKELVMVRKGMSKYLPYALPYRNFIAHTQQRTKTEKSLQFFSEMLSDVEQTSAPFGLHNVQGDGSAIREERCRVPEQVAQKIVAISKSLKITPAVILHCVWAIVVGRCSGRSDIVFGSVMSGRLQGLQGAAEAMGVFINTLPVRVDLHNKTVRQLLEAVSETLYQLIEFEQAPLSETQKCSGMNSDTPLFSAFLNYAHTDEASTDVKQVKLFEGVELLQLMRRTNYPFNLNIDHYGDSFILDLQIDEAIDCGLIMDYVQNCLADFAEALSGDQDKPVAALNVLNQSEQHKLIFDWNQTAQSYDMSRTISQLFEEQTLRTPDATALSFDFEHWTYEEVNQEANQLAHTISDSLKNRLTHNTDERDTPLVALYFDRSIEMLVSILAVLKAGAAYVPVSPDYPEQRTRFILDDAETPLILTQKKHLNGLQKVIAGCTTRPQCITADESKSYAAAPVTNPTNNHTGKSLAYVIYTSGTTGNPKGVMVEQHSVLNHMAGIRHTLGDVLTDVDFATSYCFDLSVTSYLFPLLCGGCVHIFKDDFCHPEAYAQHLKDNQVQFVKTTPGIASLIAPYMVEAGVSLKAMLLGGEPLTEHCIRQLTPVVENLFNEYGPTEATIGTTATRVAHPQQTHIGKAFLNVCLYVLSDDLAPVPTGVTGELFIGGAGIARGYLNRPDLNDSRFIRNPFASEAQIASGWDRLYRTGDLVRYLPDGNLEFMGRNDFQVKVNGYRIELPEIEKALLTCDLTEQACVLMAEIGGKPVLSAFVTGSNELQPETIKSEIRQFLPEYMVPQRIVLLDNLPLTTNGKVNRAALSALKDTAVQSIVEPRSELELRLYDIWCQLLNSTDFGVEDNFFSLGGDSILCIKLVAKLRSEGWQLQVAQIFDAPTVAGLAQIISRQDDTVNQIICEQGELTGEFGLLPQQQNFLSLSASYVANAAVSGFIRLPDDVTELQIEQAIRTLEQQHDVLRCCFDLSDEPARAIYQPCENYVSAEVNTLDCKDRSLSQVKNTLLKEQTVFNLNSGPLMYARLLQGLTEMPKCLYLTIHPMVADELSLGILAEDLIQLLQGESLPLKTSSYRQWVQLCHDSLKQRIQSETAYWQQILKDNEEYRLNTDRAHPLSVFNLVLDLQTSQDLQKQANRAYNTRVSDLLLSGLSIGLHGLFQQSMIPVTLESHGREVSDANLDVSRTVGKFASLFAINLPVFLRQNSQQEAGQFDLNEIVPQTKELLHSLPHAGLGLATLQTEKQLSQTLPGIKFRYLGKYQSPSETAATGRLLHFEEQTTGLTECHPEFQLSIDCYFVQGQFHFCISSHLAPSLNQTLSESLSDGLQMVVRHCLAVAAKGGVKTPSDYGVKSMSVAQLQQLQRKFKDNLETTQSAPARKNKIKV